MSKEWELKQSFQSSFGRIAYDVIGDGPPLVLIHGTPSSSYLWRNVVEQLKGDFTIYLHDFLGYGSSEQQPNQNVSIALQTQIMVELLDFWNLENPNIAGHDFGGAVALRSHLQEGRTFQKMVLIDAVAIAPWCTPFSQLVKDNLHVFQAIPEYVYNAMLAAHLRSAINKEMSDLDLEFYMKPWRGREGQAAYFRAVAEYDDKYTLEVEPQYKDIDIPVLVMWGEKDVWLPIETGRKLSEIIPNAQFQTIPNAGHFSPEDKPVFVATHIDEFLHRKHEAATGTRMNALL